MRRCTIIKNGILIFLFFASASAQNKERTKETYIQVIKDFYEKIYSPKRVHVKDAIRFFGIEMAAEMESYFFEKECEKYKKKPDECTQNFHQIYGWDIESIELKSATAPSVFFEALKKQKLKLTQGLDKSQIMRLLDSSSEFIDENEPDYVLILLPFPNGEFICFVMNKYVDEPIFIGNIYLGNCNSLFDEISVDVDNEDYFRLFGIVNDSDGYVNIRKSPDMNSPVVGMIKKGEDFFFTPNVHSKWWFVQKLDAPGPSSIYVPIVEGYVYYDRISPKYSKYRFTYKK